MTTFPTPKIADVRDAVKAFKDDEDGFFATYSRGRRAVNTWVMVDGEIYPANAIFRSLNISAITNGQRYNTSDSYSLAKKLGLQILKIGGSSGHALKPPNQQPVGKPQPDRRTYTVNGFRRDSAIRDYIRLNANGRCEFCGKAPFMGVSGIGFLETHHVIPVSEGGQDVVENVVALCPNHHMEAHHGAKKVALRQKLLNIAKVRQFEKVVSV